MTKASCMELPFRSAAVSALVHATEDEQKVLAAMRVLLPEGVQPKRQKLSGYHGNPILSLKAEFRRSGQLRELWQRVLAKLHAGEMEKLGLVAPGRVDDKCFLYLRFDKQLAHAGELALTESGDAVRLKLKVAAFPAKPEAAVKMVKEFIKVGATR